MANFHYYIALLYSPTDAAPLTVSLETNPNSHNCSTEILLIGLKPLYILVNLCVGSYTPAHSLITDNEWMIDDKWATI